MTFLPPDPEDWTPDTLRRVDAATHSHEITLGGALFYIRGWERTPDGATFQSQPAGDAEFAAMADDLAGRTKG